jgi:hypothetical protein
LFTLVTLVRYPDLYERMKESALENSLEEVNFRSAENPGQPSLAKTYNELAVNVKDGIIIFLHDDTYFATKRWDEKLEREFKETGADIMGVTGADEYNGDTLFSAGHPHIFGKYLTLEPNTQEEIVKVCSFTYPRKQLKVVDGLFLAVRASWFQENKFDEQFDGLFYYAEDLCLRGKVFLSNLLIGHSKPKDKWGKYPEGLKPVTDYDSAFLAKHSLTPKPQGDDRSIMAPYSEFKRLGQNGIFEEFRSAYLEKK